MINIWKLDNTQTAFVIETRGYEILVSYSTVVAVYNSYSKVFVETDHFHSRTTKKHINSLKDSRVIKREMKALQDELDHMVEINTNKIDEYFQIFTT